MTQEQILNQVTNSDWQPEFKFTDDLYAAIDSILKPCEDYCLRLHDKVMVIMFHNIELMLLSQDYKITFADVCNWQKELFEYKKKRIKSLLNNSYESDDYSSQRMLLTLPNQHINLGLRTTNVKVGNWTPPAPMFLEDLKEMCFPLDLQIGREQDNFPIQENLVLNDLTNWYKIFETIYFFEDLNGRLGGIVINILSYLLTGKYLIKL